ncbi:MAG: 2-octaprenyl-6-methoxyphenyl hydroxylase [Lysobacterales bacterium]
MSNQYDITIVGGGLVGASLALALAQQHWRVAVLERAPFREVAPPTYDDRTLALSLASRNILNAIGLWQDLSSGSAAQQNLTPIRSVQVTNKGAPGVVNISAQEQGLEALGYVVQARTLGQQVLQRLPAAAGVDLLVPCELTNIAVSQDKVKVGYTKDGKPHALTTQLLIGADGTHSRVRDAVGIQTEHYDYRQRAIIANVTPQIPHDGRAFERMTETGPLAMLPHVEQRCGVVWTCNHDQADDILALDDKGFLAALQRRFGYRLGIVDRLGARASYPLSRVTVQTPVAQRTILVGNAAHTIHPVAAQGFNLGLRDVAALCEVLSDARTNDADPGSAELLAEYARWRESDVARTVAFTDGMVRAFSQQFAPVAIARSAGLVALQLMPRLRNAIAHRGMGFGGDRTPAMALDNKAVTQ